MKIRLIAALCACLIGATPALAQDKIKFKVMGQPLSGGMIQKNKEQPFFETLAAKTGLPIEIDYKAQEVEAWRLLPQEGGMPRIDGGKIEVVRDEPLRRELADFVAAVRDGRPPGVSGAQGRAALVLANDIVARMRD